VAGTRSDSKSALQVASPRRGAAQRGLGGAGTI